MKHVLMQKMVVLLIIVFGYSIANAGEYDFDVDSFKKKLFEYSGVLTLNPEYTFLNQKTPLYLPKYSDRDIAFIQMYTLSAFADFGINWNSMKGYISGKGTLQLEYTDSSIFDYEIKPYEAYLSGTIDKISLSIWGGKKVFKWGKGYAYNPANFASRPKDINDIDASLEGYYSVSAEYIRSFSGALSNIAITTGIIPVYNLLNEGFRDINGVSVFSQMYMLLLNTDIDVAVIADNNIDIKVGAGVSKNLFSNLEVHAEWAVDFKNKHTSLKYYEAASDVVNEFVGGIRYLTPFNTTIIAEYIYNGNGANPSEMNTWFQLLDNAVSGYKNPLLSQQMKDKSGQFVMRNYAYLKFSQPEIFNILYFNPSLYTIINIDDQSFSAGVDISYTRFTNIRLSLKYALLYGEIDSEYGSKPGRHKIGFKAEWSF
ncbi:MAG: hypothetical protein GX639_10655 [Fibrobacter sp.]|nr:hypothetical protein [Fibrobacter sp.]